MGNSHRIPQPILIIEFNSGGVHHQIVTVIFPKKRNDLRNFRVFFSSSSLFSSQFPKIFQKIAKRNDFLCIDLW